MCQVNGPSYSVQCDQCDKSMKNTDDICPHCKHDYSMGVAMEARLKQELPVSERIERTVKCTTCHWYTPGVPQAELIRSLLDAAALHETIATLRAELARERERHQETQKERNTLQDDLFEMCKLCHKYQNELWTNAKIAASPAPVATGESIDA